MNSYKYRKSNISFNKRLRETVNTLKRELKNGNIKTETDYAYTLKSTITEFYKTVGKPSFKLHLASDVPSLYHYNDMISKAKTDMEVIVDGAYNICKDIAYWESEMNDTIDILSKRTDNVYSKALKLERKVKEIRDADTLMFSDDFISDKNTHKENSFETSSYADTANGMITLPPTSNSTISEDFEVKILDSSNGFPGNTHEVYYSIGNLYNDNVKFKGENDPRLELGCILETTSRGSWFEFEMFNISDEIKAETSMIGFKYKEDVYWISDDETLKLDLLLYADYPMTANYINIIGIPKTNDSVSNPILKKVTISDDIVGVQVIEVNKELVDNIVVSFNTQLVKEIKIELEQSERVTTKVCRNFSVVVDPTKIPYFIESGFKDYSKIEKPIHSIEMLGLKYDKSNRSIIYPDSKNKNDFLNKEYVKSKLFYSKGYENNFRSKTDVVEAYRYNIGIKTIDVKFRTYTESCIYISEDFICEEPIRTLTLNSSDFIPNKFKEFLKDNESIYDFIKYFISFDGGGEWHNISPRHKSHLSPCTIIVNSNAAISNRNRNIKYIDILTDPTEFKLKIEITRPEEVNDETPIVYNYFVEVSTEESL